MRAGMVHVPEQYAWSSVHANLGSRFDALVTPHSCLLGLGKDQASRIVAYRQWLHAPDDHGEVHAIRAHALQQRAYGDTRFQAMVERTLNRPAALRASGRPAKCCADSS